MPAPVVPAGDRADGGPQTFGAFTLYLTLAARLPARTAGGRRPVGRRLDAPVPDGVRTVVPHGRADRPFGRRDGRGSPGAVSTWAAAMPAGQVTTTAGAGPTATATATAIAIAIAPSVELTACDPGASARAGPENTRSAP